MSKAWCSKAGGGIRLTIQVVPNGKKNEVIGLQADALKIRLQAQPVDGKAKDALVRYIADLLDVSRSVVDITHGYANKRKIIEIGAPHLTVDAVSRIVQKPETSAQ
jgi:uncharacterized protein (TIGR00251 family)